VLAEARGRRYESASVQALKRRQYLKTARSPRSIIAAARSSMGSLVIGSALARVEPMIIRPTSGSTFDWEGLDGARCGQLRVTARWRRASSPETQVRSMTRKERQREGRSGL